MTTTTATIERHFVTTADRYDLRIPSRCCSECRGPREPVMLDPPPNQFSYCAVCFIMWRTAERVPGWWAREWVASRATAISTAVWILIMAITFLGALYGAIWYAAIELQTDDTVTILGLVAGSCLAWAAGILILGPLYTLALYGIESGWRYLMNSPITEDKI